MRLPASSTPAFTVRSRTRPAPSVLSPNQPPSRRSSFGGRPRPVQAQGEVAADVAVADGVIVNSRFSRRSTETLEILDKAYSVLRVDEQIDAPAIGLSATNRYWVDPRDGFILQSEQQLTSQLRVKLVQLTPDRRHLP